MDQNFPPNLNSSAPKSSPLPYVLAIVFGAALIGLGVFAGFALTRPEETDYNSSSLYLAEDDASASVDFSKSFDELNTASSAEENIDIDIPDNYGIDQSATYRNYTSVNSEDSLFADFSLSGIALVKETLSDYFSFAYPAFSSIKFSETYFTPDSPLTLVSDSGKTFSVKLSVEKAEKSELYSVKNVEILSSDGKSLLSYDGKFFDFSAFGAEDSLINSNGFEDIFNESSEDETFAL